MENKDLIIAIIAAAATILAALITVIGKQFSQSKQFKRDGKTIDGISSDTSDMKSKMQRIDDNAGKSRDLLVESVNPALEKIKERNAKIDFIAGEMEYQKRMKSSLSESASGRDSVLASISVVYEENARLNEQYRRAQERIIHLSVENNQLQEKVTSLKKDLAEERSKNRPRGDRGDDFER